MKPFILWTWVLIIALIIVSYSAVKNPHISPPTTVEPFGASEFLDPDPCLEPATAAYETRNWEKMARGFPCEDW